VIRIENLLSREIGLCASSIGSSAIEFAVKTRMRDSGCLDFERYTERVQQSKEELRSLIEHIVVSETWFFRDGDVFRALVEHVNGTWRRAHGRRPLRVLSIPCATGEEAYSIAITLLDAGILPQNFSVQAFDISGQAVEAARRGIYGKNSLRGEPLGDRKRYFDALRGGELQVGEAARESVRIEKGNLLDPALVPSHSKFDVIFCRNVLIYLDRSARTRALDNLLGWLTSDGILFAGHAEALDGMDRRFQRLEAFSHFAYSRRPFEKPSEVALPTERLTAPQRSSQKAAQAQVTPAAGRKTAPQRPPPQRAGARLPEVSLPTQHDTLAEVSRLADRGDLLEAARECERIIQRAGASAPAYCLLGVVKKALGDPETALECFTKALYLDHQHYESLVHVAMLHEQRGDGANAENFRRRAQRQRKVAK
jgi:chemotaxis protein methyltransferase WspC